MHGPLGHTLVLIALGAACFGSIVGFWAGAKRNLQGLRWTQYAAYVFSAGMILANIVMMRALLARDFTVSYVTQVGSSEVPTWVAVVSLWSSLEGSILFWGAILGLYVFFFTFSLRDRYREYMPYALGTILAVAAFFAFLIVGPADPFMLIDPAPPDGPGPNPLLQNHVLMVIHPPMLYFGYVGMTIPFGIAVAALLRGQLSAGWLKPLRRWTLIPWTFLGIGIVLGGWWAYEVLGWGGYWAWDPVENASFLPWLAATGYLHSTVVQERRKILKAWTLSLVLAAFLLTILGTFMTRSGVFNSVHSFTQSSIGPVFLGFLGVALVVSLGLLVGRSHLLEAEGRIEALVSREAAFMVNNAIFATFTFTVLLGTVFPLIVEAVKGTKMSVGEPYFNSMAVPIGLVMVFLMGVGPALPWGRPDKEAIIKSFVAPISAAMVTVALCLLAGLREPLAIFTFALCGFAAWVTLREMLAPGIERKQRRDESWGTAILRGIAGTRRRFGGYVVHLAVIAIVMAITGSQTYRFSKEVSLVPGESVDLNEYTLTYNKTGAEELPHRVSVFAEVTVTRGDEEIAVLSPKLNFYESQREPIGTPHVKTVGSTDIYLSLLSFENVQGGSGRVGLKAYLIPMVPWIWWALPVIALGSLISLWPRRRSAATTVPADAVGQTS